MKQWTAAVLLLLFSCSSQEVASGKKGTTPVWQEVPVEAIKASDQGPRTQARPDEKAGLAPGDAGAGRGDGKSPGLAVDPPQFFPAQVAVWRAAFHPEALSLVSPRDAAPKGEDLADLSYLHPSFPGKGNLARLTRRFIAKDGKARNFDMRDAVMLPVPATLEATVPAFGRATLSLSYCVKSEFFPGNKSAMINLAVAYKTEEEGHQLLESKLDPAVDGRCRSWTDISLPLPASQGESARVIIGVTSPLAAARSSDAVII